jgi:flagellar assembly protein FliH
MLARLLYHEAEVTILSFNLLKRQYVYNEQTATRIINSNQKMEEKMKELVRIYQMPGAGAKKDSLSADFVEGILSDEVSPDDVTVNTYSADKNAGIKGIEGAVPQENHTEDPKEIVAEAEAEANRILEDAKLRADQMLEEANEKAHELYKEQKDIGYKDGTAEGEKELSRKLADMEAHNSSLQQAMEVDYQEKLGTMENDLVDAIIQVFDKVFHIQFEDKQDILLHLINNTISSVDSEKKFRIFVSDDNWQYVEDHLSSLREQLGSDVSLEVSRDSKLSSRDCRIETATGIYDCGMDQELDGLCRDIRSLCC